MTHLLLSLRTKSNKNLEQNSKMEILSSTYIHQKSNFGLPTTLHKKRNKLRGRGFIILLLKLFETWTAFSCLSASKILWSLENTLETFLQQTGFSSSHCEIVFCQIQLKLLSKLMKINSGNTRSISNRNKTQNKISCSLLLS